jgi:hypothetical protein
MNTINSNFSTSFFRNFAAAFSATSGKTAAATTEKEANNANIVSVIRDKLTLSHAGQLAYEKHASKLDKTEANVPTAKILPPQARYDQNASAGTFTTAETQADEVVEIAVTDMEVADTEVAVADAGVIEAEIVNANVEDSSVIHLVLKDTILTDIKFIMEKYDGYKIHPETGRPYNWRIVPTRDGAKLSEAEQKEVWKAISVRYDAIQGITANGGIPEGKMAVIDVTAGEWHYAE